MYKLIGLGLIYTPNAICSLELYYLATFLFLTFSVSFSTCFSNNKHKKEPELLKIFKEAYPQVDFKSEYDSNLNDWKIIITTNNKSEILYWADGKFLPVDELKNKDLHSPFLYNYPKEIPNPQNFINTYFQFSIFSFEFTTKQFL